MTDDRTINSAGAGNQLPVSDLVDCDVTRLVDSLVRDGWLAPEDRMRETAAMLQGQLAAARRALRRAEDRLAAHHAAVYSLAWHTRYLDYRETQP